MIRIDRGAIRQAAKYDGKWVLQTNDDTISLEDAASGQGIRKRAENVW